MSKLYRIVLSPETLQDLEELHAYIASDSVDAADKVYSRIELRIDDLATMPYVYRVYQHRKNPALTVHIMSVNPYIVYYRVSESSMTVDVARILHGVRRQPRRFR